MSEGLVTAVFFIVSVSAFPLMLLIWRWVEERGYLWLTAFDLVVIVLPLFVITWLMEKYKEHFGVEQ